MTGLYVATDIVILIWKRSRGLKEVEKSKALVQVSGMVRSMPEKVRPNGWNGIRSKLLSMRNSSTTCDPLISPLFPRLGYSGGL